jgi:hypothetical protein
MLTRLTILVLAFTAVTSSARAQTRTWDAVKAVPPGTVLRLNDSLTGRLDSVDDTHITVGGRRLRQDVIRRVERVESRRKHNVGLALLGGFAGGAIAARINGSNALGMIWSGALWGGLVAGAAATGSPPKYVVIYQR